MGHCWHSDSTLRMALNSDPQGTRAQTSDPYHIPPSGPGPAPRREHCEIIVIRDKRMYAPGDYLKVELRDEQTGEAEWMWVRVESDDPALRVVFGTLDSESVVCAALRLGQQLAVSYDNIRDHRTTASFNPV